MKLCQSIVLDRRFKLVFENIVTFSEGLVRIAKVLLVSRSNIAWRASMNVWRAHRQRLAKIKCRFQHFVVDLNEAQCSFGGRHVSGRDRRNLFAHRVNDALRQYGLVLGEHQVGRVPAREHNFYPRQ